MTNRLTHSEKASRLDAFLSNDDNFEAVQYNDPRAIARRARNAARFHKAEAVRAVRAEQTAAQAALLVVGQAVSGARGLTGRVVAIDGATVSVDLGGAVRKFIATALTAA